MWNQGTQVERKPGTKKQDGRETGKEREQQLRLTSPVLPKVSP